MNEIEYNPFSEIKSKLIDLERMLLQISASNGGSDENVDKWMNLNELQNYLPDTPSKETLYYKLSKGEIKGYKKGKS